MKTLANIFLTKQAGEWYSDILSSLFGNTLSIRSYNQEDGSIFQIAPADLYLLNTNFIPEEQYQKIPREHIIYPKMTFRRDSIEQLYNLPFHETILMANRSLAMAIEAISSIVRFVSPDLNFYPYEPGIKIPTGCHIAVTTGLSEILPPEIDTIIDLGPRLLQADTIAEIALKLNLPEILETSNYQKYISELFTNSYSLENLSANNFRTESKLTSLLSALPLGIIGIDQNQKVFAYNKAAENMLGVSEKQILHQSVELAATFIPQKFFPSQNHFAQERNPRIIRFHNTDFSVSSAPIMRNETIQGYFTILQPFAEEEKTQHKLRLQLLKKGYTTKYCFDDIITACPKMLQAKSIAQKMAATNASILLVGESGTGKELFAHSIHHSSPRKDMPFIAINCAALPESLLESELFGYADGAFTGARKGGKLGLFEHAHHGTLFLDEIEGMSQNLQIKLLRVLQEKEIMRVGGSEIIPIDVRIIAASNENMQELVSKGTFRKDLYYRLNTMPLEIPPLRFRGQDILLLLNHIKAAIGADFSLTPETEELLLHHPWEGNVRELRNLAEYLKYIDVPVITKRELPQTFFSHKKNDSDLLEFYRICGHKKEKGMFLLQTFHHSAEKGIIPGRRQISALAAISGLSFSEQEIRTLTAHFQAAGFLDMAENHRGYYLTDKGEALLLQCSL